MSARCKRTSLELLLLLLFVCGMGAQAQRVSRQTIVLLPGATAQEMDLIARQASPTGRYALGWMVCRTRRLPEGEGYAAATALTINAGGQVGAQEAFESAPASTDWLAQWQGLLASHRGAEAWGRLGILGDVYRRQNALTAAVGNGDLPGRPVRNARLLASDGEGRVSVDESALQLLPDPAAPYGVMTDFQSLLRLSLDAKKNASLVAIEIGDLQRASLYAPFCRLSEARRMRLESLQKVIAFLKAIAESGEPVWVYSFPRASSDELDRLGVVALVNSSETGLLTSLTTRLPGLIASYDLTPALIGTDSFEGRRLVGQAASVKSDRSPLATLRQLERQWEWQASQRRLWSGLPSVLALIVLVASFVYKSRGRRRAFSIGVFVVCALCLLAAFGWLKPPGLWAGLLGAMGVAWGISVGKGRVAVPLALSVIALDWWLGGLLFKSAVWGVNPAWGTRFYGVGNQAASVAAGLTLLYGGMSRTRHETLVAWGMFGVLGGLLFFKGVNGGMAIAIGAGLLAGYWELFPTGKARLSLILGVPLMLALLLMLAPGHLGRIQTLGWEALFQTGASKLFFNARALLSQWSVLLIAVGLALRGLRPFKNEASAEARIWQRIWVVTAGVAFFVKDLGIVVAALLALFFWVWHALFWDQETNRTQT